MPLKNVVALIVIQPLPANSEKHCKIQLCRIESCHKWFPPSGINCQRVNMLFPRKSFNSLMHWHAEKWTSPSNLFYIDQMRQVSKDLCTPVQTVEVMLVISPGFYVTSNPISYMSGNILLFTSGNHQSFGESRCMIQHWMSRSSDHPHSMTLSL